MIMEEEKNFLVSNFRLQISKKKASSNDPADFAENL